MSNGDGEDDESAEPEAADDAALSPDTLGSRLDEAEAALEGSETEADLDDVEATLDDVAADLDAADRPGDEDAEDPLAEFDDRLDGLRGDLETARGPYATDVTEAIDEAAATLRDAEWTDDGEADAVAAVETFAGSAGEVLDESFEVTAEDGESAASALEQIGDAVEDAGLDPDDDADTIAALVEAATALSDGLEAAEVWSDLTIRQQLDAQGFYDILDPATKKDFPPEWNAIKLYATNGETEPILTALERYESDFMEENILDALERYAPVEAFEPINARAERRDKHAIRLLGKIGDERAIETVQDFLGGGDVELELVTLRALGAIGSAESTQAVADRLVAETPEIRSTAARALGMIGDTRAIDPLETRLAEDDADEVRASAAWSLRQIGTERALEIAGSYADDRSYIVQAEAEKAAGA